MKPSFLSKSYKHFTCNSWSQALWPEECFIIICFSNWNLNMWRKNFQRNAITTFTLDDRRLLMPMKKYIILWVFCLYSLWCIGQLPLVFYIIYRQQGIAIKLNNIFIVENRSESNWKASTQPIIVHNGIIAMA